MKNKAIVFSLALIFLTSVASVYAVSDHSNEKAKEHNQASSQVTPSRAPRIQGSDNDDDCDDDVKNHGEYVSCIAHEHEGGRAVSEAAHSDIGKKHDSEDDDDDIVPTVIPSISPSISPSVTPSVTPTGTQSISPTATPTTEPSVTPTGTPSGAQANESIASALAGQINALIDELKGLIGSLTNLLHD